MSEHVAIQFRLSTERMAAALERHREQVRVAGGVVSEALVRMHRSVESIEPMMRTAAVALASLAETARGRRGLGPGRVIDEKAYRTMRRNHR